MKLLICLGGCLVELMLSLMSKNVGVCINNSLTKTTHQLIRIVQLKNSVV